jgi:hypothetical protein
LETINFYKMTAEELLQLVSEQLSLDPPLALDEDRTCELVFDDRVWIEFYVSEDGSVINICTMVSFLPEDPKLRMAVQELLLSANLFGRGTGGANFSVDSENQEVVLTSVLELEQTDVEEFTKVIENLINFQTYWSAKLAPEELEKTLKEFAKAQASAASEITGLEGADGGVF